MYLCDVYVCVWHYVYVHVYLYICAYKYISDADLMLKPASNVKDTLNGKYFIFYVFFFKYNINYSMQRHYAAHQVFFFFFLRKLNF